MQTFTRLFCSMLDLTWTCIMSRMCVLTTTNVCDEVLLHATACLLVTSPHVLHLANSVVPAWTWTLTACLLVTSLHVSHLANSVVPTLTWMSRMCWHFGFAESRFVLLCCYLSLEGIPIVCPRKASPLCPCPRHLLPENPGRA